jgi:hypothetical protein
MSFLSSIMPVWASLSLFIAMCFAIIFLARIAEKGSVLANFDKATARRHYWFVLGFYGVFFLYVAIMSFTGIFRQNTMLPPWVILLTTMPLMVIYISMSLFNNTFSRIFQSISLSTLIRFHVIRFIGTFFLIAYTYEALPSYFALSAGIGDIFAAVTAIFVAQLTDKQVKNYKTIALIWNIVGLIDILNVFFTAIIITQQTIKTGDEGVSQMGYFPFSLIPAFAPATIMFFHMLVFKKLTTQRTLVSIA